jgi:hypothetical protein
MRKVILLTILLLLITTPQFTSVITNWKTLVTDSFVIYYHQNHELQAYNALQALEYHRNYVEELTGNKRKRFPVVIEDIGNVANGFANPVADKIVLFTHFPTNSQLGYYEDWWSMLGVHEYIHILQITNEGGIPRVLRKALGNIMYTNFLQPTFMLEGITVFGESDIHPYTGRMNGGYYPAIIATLAQTDQLPDRTKANYFSADNPLGNYYVYGGSFYRYLANQYGREKFSELYNFRGRSSRSWVTPLLPGIGLDPAFRKVYGKNISSLWNEWQECKKSKDFDLPESYLTDDGWYKYSLNFKGDKLYYLSRTVSKTGAGRSFSANSLKSYDIKSGETTTIHRQAGQYPAGYYLSFNSNNQPLFLYYTRNEYRRGFANTTSFGRGSVPELCRLDLETDTTENLFRGSFRAFGVLDDGTVLIAKDIENDLGSEIYRIRDKDAELIMRSDYLIHSIKVNRGRVYVDARRFWRNASIFELDLERMKLVKVIDSPVSESISGFVNDKIIYTANYDEYLKSYLIDPDTKEVKKIAGASFMTSAIIENETTYFLSLSPKGYEIAEAELALEDFYLPHFPENSKPFHRIRDLDLFGDNQSSLNLRLDDSSFLTENVAVKESGYWRNVSHLLFPRQYRIPSIVYGADEFIIIYEIGGNDAVGHFPVWSALLKYDVEEAEFDYEVFFSNRLLSPLKHDLYYSNVDETTLTSDQYVDIIERINWGVHHLRAGISYKTKQDFHRKILNPYIDIGLHSFDRQMWNRFSFVTEKENYLYSDRDRNGFLMYNNLRQKLPFDSEAVFRLFAAYDPDADKSEVFDSIRGYREGLEANQGAVLQSSLSTILFRVRSGLWNPQVYVEDVGISLFFDAAVPREGEGADMQYSFGLELLTETNFGFFFPLYIGHQISYNREKEINYSLMLTADFIYDRF